MSLLYYTVYAQIVIDYVTTVMITLTCFVEGLTNDRARVSGFETVLNELLFNEILN